jgi:hypothetical protein
MAKGTKDTAPDVYELEGFEGRYGPAEDYTIGFENYSADSDLAPLFKGLPDDRCQCPHGGRISGGPDTTDPPHHGGHCEGSHLFWESLS